MYSVQTHTYTLSDEKKKTEQKIDLFTKFIVCVVY